MSMTRITTCPDCGVELELTMGAGPVPCDCPDNTWRLVASTVRSRPGKPLIVLEDGE